MKAAILFFMLPMCTLAVLTDVTKCFTTLKNGVKVAVGRCEDRLVDGACEGLFDAPTNNGVANAQVDERCYIQTDLSNSCPDRCMQCCEKPMYDCENVASQETCAAMKQSGKCENAAVKDYMIEYCPHTCGFCELTVEDTCGEGWKGYRPTQKCFKVFPEPKIFNQASTACHNAGGALAVPKSKAENDFIGMNVTDEEVLYGQMWLGIRKISGIFSPIEGGVLTYKNWIPGQPDGDGECAQLSQLSLNRWNDLPCSSARSFACEKPISSNAR